MGMVEGAKSLRKQIGGPGCEKSGIGRDKDKALKILLVQKTSPPLFFFIE